MSKRAAQRVARYLIVLGFRVKIRQHKSAAGVEFLATLPLGVRQKGNRKCGL
jgi:hypothetical protein